LTLTRCSLRESSGRTQACLRSDGGVVTDVEDDGRTARCWRAGHPLMTCRQADMRLSTHAECSASDGLGRPRAVLRFVASANLSCNHATELRQRGRARKRERVCVCVCVCVCGAALKYTERKRSRCVRDRRIARVGPQSVSRMRLGLK